MGRYGGWSQSIAGEDYESVVSQCSSLLGTSQKCLNIHFFAEELPHQTSQAGKIDWGVGQARFAIHRELTWHFFDHFDINSNTLIKPRAHHVRTLS